MNKRTTAALQLIVAIFLAALVGVFAKISLGRVSPFTFNWLQVAVCLLFLTGYRLIFSKEPVSLKLLPRQWLLIAAIGIANFTVVRYLFLAGLETLPVTTHAYLVNFVGLITMFMSVILLKESPYLIQLFGALLAISGLYVFFEELPAPQEWRGILYVFFGILFLALTNNLIRYFMITFNNTVSVMTLSTLAIWFGGLPVILYGLWVEGFELDIKPFDWAVIIANGVFALALNLIVFNKVLKHLRSYEASILASCGVVFTAILAWPILGEHLSLAQITGILILICGILLTQFQIQWSKILVRLRFWQS